MSSTRHYFDHAASAPLDPRVAEAMRAAEVLVGNPSSLHAEGRAVRAGIERARTQMADLLGVEAGEVVFTSGATEANVLAVVGAMRPVIARHPGRTPRVVTSPFEHASVAEAVRRLERDHRVAVDVLPSGKDGVVDAAALRRLLTADTAMICVMWANNVLGSVQPIAEIGRIAAAERARRAEGDPPLLFMSDAVQAVGSGRVSPRDAGVDLLTVSAHKIGGPKGAGACFIRRGVDVDPVIVGGGQEGGRRHGTQDAAGIVGLGAAAAIAAAEGATEASRLRILRDAFVSRLSSAVPGAVVVGADGDAAAPHIAYVLHPRERGDVLALKLDEAGFAVSSGSACDAGSRKPPAALAAALGERASRGGVRVSFGRGTTAAGVAELAGAIARA